jgi:hypothetical protein
MCALHFTPTLKALYTCRDVRIVTLFVFFILFYLFHYNFLLCSMFLFIPSGNIIRYLRGFLCSPKEEPTKQWITHVLYPRRPLGL